MVRRDFRPRASARARGFVGLLFVAAVSPAGATGFFVNQQSVKDLGRVGAGSAAMADGLGTIYLNPAGLTQVWTQGGGRHQVEGGLHLIIPHSTLTDTGSTATTPGTLGTPLPSGGSGASNPTDPAWIPNVYWAHRLDERTAIGVGINAPFGLKTSYQGDWFGRYDATSAALTTVNVSFVGAYQVNRRVSIGGGLDYQYANSQLATAVPNPLAAGGPTPGTDGRAETRGHDWSPGFNVGALVDLTDRTRFGVHYRSAITHTVRGSTTVTGLTGPLAAFNGITNAEADLHLPGIATLSLRHAATNDLRLLANLEWYDWSRFREVRIRFANGSPDSVRTANYRDAFAIAFGAEYRVSGSWNVRGGIRFDQTPTVDDNRDTTVPDARRLWLGLGASYQPRDRWFVDMAYNHVFFRTTNVAVTRTFFDGTPLASRVDVHGQVKSSVNTLSVALRYAY